MDTKNREEQLKILSEQAPKFKESHLYPHQKEFEDKETVSILRSLFYAERVLRDLEDVLRDSPVRESAVLAVIRLEARFSSLKENYGATFGQISEIQATGSSKNKKNSIKVAKNEDAIRLARGIKGHNKTITAQFAQDICRELVGEVDSRYAIGNLIGDETIPTVDFVPAKHKENHMLRWQGFIQENSKIHDIVKMAISHFQFETIHPFEDGNGRTGRIINTIMIRNSGLSSDFSIPLSLHIAEHSREYIDCLNKISTEEDWNPYIEFMINCVITGAKFSLSMAKDMSYIYNECLKDMEDKIDGSEDKLLFLFENPVCTAKSFAKEFEVSTKVARTFMDKFCKINILEKKKSEKNTNSYHNLRIIELAERR